MKYYTKPQLVEIFSYDEVYKIWESLDKPKKFIVGEYYKLNVCTGIFGNVIFGFDDNNCGDDLLWLHLNQYIVIAGKNDCDILDGKTNILEFYNKELDGIIK